MIFAIFFARKFKLSRYRFWHIFGVKIQNDQNEILSEFVFPPLVCKNRAGGANLIFLYIISGHMEFILPFKQLILTFSPPPP